MTIPIIEYAYLLVILTFSCCCSCGIGKIKSAPQQFEMWDQTYVKPLARALVSAADLDRIAGLPEARQLNNLRIRALEAIITKYTGEVKAPLVSLGEWDSLTAQFFSMARAKGISDGVMRQKQNELLPHVVEVWNRASEAIVNDCRRQGGTEDVIRKIQLDPEMAALRNHFASCLSALITLNASPMKTM